MIAAIIIYCVLLALHIYIEYGALLLFVMHSHNWNELNIRGTLNTFSIHRLFFAHCLLLFDCVLLLLVGPFAWNHAVLHELHIRVIYMQMMNFTKNSELDTNTTQKMIRNPLAAHVHCTVHVYMQLANEVYRVEPSFTFWWYSHSELLLLFFSLHISLAL